MLLSYICIFILHKYNNRMNRQQAQPQPQTKWLQNKELVYNVIYELIMEENLTSYRETILQYFEQVMSQAFKKQFQYKNYEQMNIEVLEHMNQYLENIVIQQQKQLQYQEQMRKQQQAQQQQQQQYMNGVTDSMDRMNAMGFTREDIHQKRTMKISNEFERKKQEFEGTLELKKPQEIDFRDTPKEDGRKIDELMEEEIKKRNSQLEGVNQFYNVPVQQAEKWIFNGRVPENVNTIEQIPFQEPSVPNTLQMIGQGNKELKEEYYREKEANTGIQIQYQQPQPQQQSREKEVSEEEKQQMKAHLQRMQQRYEQYPAQNKPTQQVNTNEINQGIRLKIDDVIEPSLIENEIEVIERKKKQVSFQSSQPQQPQQPQAPTSSFLSKLKLKQPEPKVESEPEPIQRIQPTKTIPMFQQQIQTCIHTDGTIYFDIDIYEHKQTIYIASLRLPKQYIEHTILMKKEYPLPLEHIHTLSCIFTIKNNQIQGEEGNTIIDTIYQQAYSNLVSMNSNSSSAYILYDIQLEINLPMKDNQDTTNYRIELQFDIDKMRTNYSIPSFSLSSMAYDKVQNKIQLSLLKNIHQYIDKENIDNNVYQIIKPYTYNIYSYGDILQEIHTKQKYKVLMKFDIQNNMMMNIQSIDGKYICIERIERNEDDNKEIHILNPNDAFHIVTKPAVLVVS